ncbi:hypothetical protein F4802DRAFT_620661 [Xylaria palmicola]|nr:hypothetical protein F4802DRAFT_620661 [Xylaria palmicola]
MVYLSNATSLDVNERARSFRQTQDLAVTATDLLAYDEGQLVQYLKRHESNEGFDISSLAGVRRLAENHRDELAQKLNSAALRLELNVDELLMRLTDLAAKPDGSPTPNRESSPWPAGSTPPPTTVQTLEISSRDRLVEDGGRPVCSTQELLHISAEPMSRHRAILSWLSDDPDTDVGAGEIKTVFSRQFARWWNFRKSQWNNRGLGDTEEGLSAFLEANRRRYEGMGAIAMVSAPTFDETIQHQWQRMSAFRLQLHDQSFSAYRNAVNMCLTPYCFTRRLQLRKDPRQQDAWTTWLEYLSYEKWCLESLTATAESLEQQFHESWRVLNAGDADSSIAPSRSVAFSSAQPQRPAAKTVSIAKQLEAAQADRDTSSKRIRDFIQTTEPYKRAQAAAYYQRHRVAWVVKEAHLMEAEMLQQRKAATSKKRRRDREEETSPEAQPERAKRRVSGKNAVSGATRGRPPTRSTRHTSLQSDV